MYRFQDLISKFSITKSSLIGLNTLNGANSIELRLAFDNNAVYLTSFRLSLQSHHSVMIGLLFLYKYVKQKLRQPTVNCANHKQTFFVFFFPTYILTKHPKNFNLRNGWNIQIHKWDRIMVWEMLFKSWYQYDNYECNFWDMN